MSFAGVALIVVFISTLSILLLIPVAEQVGLVDVPNNPRKLHQGKPPLIGGLSTYIGLVIGLSLFMQPNHTSLTYFICSSIIVALGVMDDAKDLSPKLRLVVQSMVAVIMCAGSGLYIENLGNLFGFGDFHLDVFGYGVTVVAVLAAINAFNMIDGVDGLLGMSSLISFLGLSALFFLNGDQDGMYLALLISLALVPYLLVNLQCPPLKLKKIFMGDTGSMLIGFTVVWLLIHGSQGERGTTSFSAATALWLIAFPLMDMTRVILTRYRNGKAVFDADRSHLHHILLRRSTPRGVLLKITALVAFFAAIGITLNVTQSSDFTVFALFLIAFAVYVKAVNKLIEQDNNEQVG